MRVRKVEIGLNIVFWGITSWFIVATKSIEIQGFELINGEKVKTIVRNQDLIKYLLIQQLFFLMLFYLQLYFIHQLNQSKRIGRFALKSVFIPVLTMVLSEAFIKSLLFDKTISLSSQGATSTLIFYLGVAICYGFIKVWYNHERDRDQLQLVKQETELNMLRSQLQPHFLFNTMNNLMAMVDQQHNPKLAQSIGKLSNLLRYVVYETQRDKVTLANEIDFIRNFADLQLLRYEEDEVDFSIRVIGNFDQQLIEPGIFICYVENALKHGVTPEEASFIHIVFNISMENEVYFFVENSISKHMQKADVGGVGIKANHERLQLAYPDRHKVEFRHDKTFVVEMNIQTS